MSAPLLPSLMLAQIVSLSFILHFIHRHRLRLCARHFLAQVSACRHGPLHSSQPLFSFLSSQPLFSFLRLLLFALCMCVCSALSEALQSMWKDVMRVLSDSMAASSAQQAELLARTAELASARSAAAAASAPAPPAPAQVEPAAPAISDEVIMQMLMAASLRSQLESGASIMSQSHCCRPAVSSRASGLPVCRVASDIVC